MKKQEGFPGQRIYVIPEKILGLIRNNPKIEDLFFTDIGYFPHAKHHSCERQTGIDQNILIYNVEGSGMIQVSDNTIHLEADQFFIIPKGVSHAYYSNKNTPWSIYWIHFGGKKARQLAQPNLQRVDVGRTKISRINERLELFKEIFQNLERGFSLESLEYTNLCLPHLLISILNRVGETGLIPVSSSPTTVRTVLVYGGSLIFNSYRFVIIQ